MKRIAARMVAWILVAVALAALFLPNGLATAQVQISAAGGAAAQPTAVPSPTTSPSIAGASASCTPGAGSLIQPGQTVTCSFAAAPNTAFVGWSTVGFTTVSSNPSAATFVANGTQSGSITANWTNWIGDPTPQNSSFGYVISQATVTCNPSSGTVAQGGTLSCTFSGPSGATFLGWSAPLLTPVTSATPAQTFAAQILGTTQITATWQESTQSLQLSFPVQVSTTAPPPAPPAAAAPVPTVTGALPIGCPTNGLLDWWPLRTTPADPVGGNPTTLDNGAAFGSTAGRQGLLLNGRGAYAGEPLPSTISGNNSLTMATWFYATEPIGTPQMLLAAETQGGILGGSGGVYLQLIGGELLLQVMVPSSAVTNVSASLTQPYAGVWHQVVATYDATTGSEDIYVDGGPPFQRPNLVGERIGNQDLTGLAPVNIDQQIAWADSTTGTPILDQLYFGAYNDSTIASSGNQPNSQYFAGALADVQFFNRALLPSEVAQLFAGSLAGTC